MSIRGGRPPRDPMAMPDTGAAAPTRRAASSPYTRAGRYGRGPGDQRRYERYGNSGGGLGGVLRFLLFLIVLAVLVLAALSTVARPLLRAVVVPLAEDNAQALKIGFIADLVKEDIGPALTAPASQDPTQVEFTVNDGDTPATLAPRLQDAGVVASPRAFLFEARTNNLAPQLVAGNFGLAKNMTPEQVVQGLINNKIERQSIQVTFREGLRIEQMVAKLMTIPDLKFDPNDFYQLAEHPTDAILGDYPWLLDENVRPKNASLEGFLYPATYTIRVDPEQPTTAEDLIRMMLTAFHDRVGDDRLNVPAKRGLTFYQVLTMASIVEREAQLDQDRPLIAGVYQNRLNKKLWPTGLLQSDPTIFYVNDSLQLQAMNRADWTKYVFWNTLPQKLPATLPPALAGYNTYTSPGLPPGPITSPALPSIDAALNPDTKPGYLFFLAKGDGSGGTVYAKTQAQHQANIQKYGKP